METRKRGSIDARINHGRTAHGHVWWAGSQNGLQSANSESANRGSTIKQVIIRETSEQQQKLCYGLSTKALISISPKSPDSETVYPVSYNVFYV